MAIRISTHLDKNCVMTEMMIEEKNALLTSMVEFLVTYYSLKNGPIIIDKILEREAAMSTGIGYGIAIPHARINGLDRLYMLAAQSNVGVDFDAIDDNEVTILFMILSPDNTAGVHTQVLSSISKIAANEEVREKLRTAPTADAFYQEVVSAEDHYLF